MRALIAFLVIIAISPCFAGSIYKYTDETGKTVYSNLGTERPGAAAQLSLASLATKGSAPTASKRQPSADAVAQYLPYIQDAATRHGVDVELIKAIIQVESNYNPMAVSSKGCKGLMQLHPDTAKRFGVQNIFDPAENIEGGVKFLKFLLEYFKNDTSKVLAGYNAGENAVTRYKGIPPYRETKDYVKKVEALYQSAELLQSALPEPTERVRKRVYRVVKPDGNILFTTEPVETMAEVAN